jgi:hypothetical protein
MKRKSKLWNSHGESLLGVNANGSFHQPTIRLNLGHDSSIRTPIGSGRERPINRYGLACAGQGHSPGRGKRWGQS